MSVSEQDLAAAYRAIFEHDLAPVVLRDLMTRFGLFEQIDAPGIDAIELAIRNGGRNAVCYILSRIGYDPTIGELIKTMQQAVIEEYGRLQPPPTLRSSG